MKTKKAFLLLVLAVGLICPGIVLGNANGPQPGVNGVFGATCTACHMGNPENAPGGSIAVSGLPTTWTPGQTYPITVTVVRPGQVRFGFQFSAVSASNSAIQGGTLSPATPNDIRVSIVTGGGIQYAQHNTLANLTGTFNFSWIAPANASFGQVRFNLAGNAADGNNLSFGDFIYTRVDLVSPAAGDTTAPVISGVRSSPGVAGAATISWTTDEASDSQVEFGTTTAYGQSTTLNPALTTAHSVILNSLAANTTYHYRAKSRDAANNLATGADAVLSTFSFSNLGGVSTITDGAGSGIATGYARVQPGTGSTAPSGVAIFGFRQGTLLVSEAGVPDSPPVTSGRIYAEVSADTIVNTGLAFANPNDTTAMITFEIRDTSDNPPFRNGMLFLAPNDHLAAFLTQDPYFSGTGFTGTFSFTSTVPVSVIALRGFVNERSDFLMTTLPVLDLSAGASVGTQVIPHFAVGDGWTTQILLVNATSGDLTGQVQFLNAQGAPVTVNVDGLAASSAAYSVKANSSQKLVVTGASGSASGSVRVVPPTEGSAAPTSQVVFTYKPGEFTQSEAGVPVTMGTAFRMYIELEPSTQINSGIAIANATGVAGNVNLSVTTLDGTPVTSEDKPLPASGQLVGFAPELLPALNGQSLKGILRITTTVPNISVVGLRSRSNERSDFLITTTPPTLENGAPVSTERFFPQIANGGGYTTQFILFSGTSGQSANGNLSFFASGGGAPLSFELN